MFILKMILQMLNADLININFLTGNINIKMYEENKKIEINKK